MAEETSLGEGIGLQSGNRSDYWMRRLADDQRIRDAKKEAADKELAAMMDIKVPFNEMYPAYAKEAQKVASSFIKTYGGMRQGGKAVPRAQIMGALYETQQKIGTILMGNKAWKDYQARADILKEEPLIQAVNSADMDFDRLSQLVSQSDPSGRFLSMGKTGEFVFTPVSSKQVETKYDTNIDYTKRETGKFRDVGGSRFFELEKFIPETVVEREGGQLALNETFIPQALYKNRAQLVPMAGETPEQFREREAGIVQKAAMDRANIDRPVGFIDVSGPQKIAAPRAGTEADRRSPTLELTEGDIMVGRGRSEGFLPDGTPFLEAIKQGRAREVEMVDKAGSGITKKQQPIKYSGIINVPDAKAVTVNLTPDELKRNPELKDRKSINFKPTNIYIVDNEDGTKELMATGIIQWTQEEEQKGTADPKIARILSYEPIISYGLVRGSVELAYRNKMPALYQQAGFDAKGKWIGGSTKPTTKSKASSSTLNFFK